MLLGEVDKNERPIIPLLAETLGLWKKGNPAATVTFQLTDKRTQTPTP